MNPSEAVELLAFVQASWPAMKLPDETVKAWAFELIGFEVVDAQVAVRDLARFQSRPPSLADLVDGCNEARQQRVQTTMLPAGRPTTEGAIGFLDWLAVQDADMQARAHKVFPSLFGGVTP